MSSYTWIVKICVHLHLVSIHPERDSNVTISCKYTITYGTYVSKLQVATHVLWLIIFCHTR
jgi:hypothetical protein